MAEAAKAKRAAKREASAEREETTPILSPPPDPRDDRERAQANETRRDEPPTRDRMDAPPERIADPHAGITLQRTIQAPDPWSIMPSRTLRGAGATHLQRRSDPLTEPETLSQRVAQEGPEAPTPVATINRWNLLIVPAQPGFRASDQGVKALVLYLDRSQLLRSPMVSTLEEFVGHALHTPEEYWRSRLHDGDTDNDSQIISLDPGVFAHQLFYEGPAPTDGTPIMAAHIGHRARSTDVPFGPADRKAAFWLALIGCRFDKVSRGFLERMHSILYLRPQVLVAPYTEPGPGDSI